MQVFKMNVAKDSLSTVMDIVSSHKKTMRDKYIENGLIYPFQNVVEHLNLMSANHIAGMLGLREGKDLPNEIKREYMSVSIPEDLSEVGTGLAEW